MKEERGATAILVAASLLLLLGFGAIAIDIGALKNERRLDQNGADSSVLAAAVELGLGGTYQSALDQVLRIVNANVRTGSAWASCLDSSPDKLPVTALSAGLTPATDCVSFFKFEEVRVRLPNQTIDTTFGRVLGASGLSTAASAMAYVDQFPGESDAPPFVVLSGFQAGDLGCLRADPGPPTSPVPPLVTGNGPGVLPTLGPDPDPCDDASFDPASQFFGTLNPIAYFNLDGTIACDKNLVEYAIAEGIDHPLRSFEPDYPLSGHPPRLEEGTGCNTAPLPGPNTMQLATGLSAQTLRCGMITRKGNAPTPAGCATGVGAPGGSVEARLHRGPHVQNVYTFLEERMDNAALWEFMLDPSGLTAPAACETLYDNRSNEMWDYFDKKDALLSCLRLWASGDDPIFDRTILTTPRFAWLPQLYEETLDSGATSIPARPSDCPTVSADKCVHFNDFVPVWLQTLYTTSPTAECDPFATGWGRHDAGQAVSCGPDNGNLDRLSSIVLDCGMLPADICVARPGVPPGGDVVPLIELTK